MLACLLILISVVDLRRHKIPNWSLILLVLFATIENLITFNPLVALLAVGIGILALALTDIGAGDVKLFFLLASLIIPNGEILRYFTGICVSTFALLLVHAIMRRGFTGRIAFAPALCGGVLATSLY